MRKVRTKWVVSLCIWMSLLSAGLVLNPAVYAQALPAMTTDQAAAAQNLSPAQKGAVAQELGKTGGQLTPEAIEALKAKPEFQNLSPAELAKGKELLQKQEAAKGEAEAAKDTAKKASEGSKQVIGDVPKGETLFERAQAIGLSLIHI